jgi:2-keto-4-pentenoate hydratase/2-oxohepta-3-ene-1,7-dioic acid hydratase in catechol pathway
MGAWLAAGGLAALRGEESGLAEVACAESGLALRAGEVRLGAPLPRPRTIICLARNYGRHAAEQGAPVMAEPVLFAKAPGSVLAPGEPLVLPESSVMVDHEVELAVVIGAPAWRVSEERALEVVAGYTVMNDVTARDLQRRDGQFFRAKSLRGFCPLGPWMVTPEELGPPDALRLRLRLNGEVVQEASTAEMIHGVARIIAFITRDIPLAPGDLIATGTPAGVGAFRDPPRFLRPGDRMEAEVEGIGVLETPVKSSGE